MKLPNMGWGEMKPSEEVGESVELFIVQVFTVVCIPVNAQKNRHTWRNPS